MARRAISYNSHLDFPDRTDFSSCLMPIETQKGQQLHVEVQFPARGDVPRSKASQNPSPGKRAFSVPVLYVDAGNAPGVENPGRVSRPGFGQRPPLLKTNAKMCAPARRFLDFRAVEIAPPTHFHAARPVCPSCHGSPSAARSFRTRGVCATRRQEGQGRPCTARRSCPARAPRRWP